MGNIVLYPYGINLNTNQSINAGEVYITGQNDYGQLGTGNIQYVYEFTKLETLPKLVTDISCGTEHTLFLLEDGSVYACGRNNSNQLGGFSYTTQYLPVKISLPKKIIQVCAGDRNSFCLSEDKTVYACGLNSYGQLGFNHTLSVGSFTEISNFGGVSKITVTGGMTFFYLDNGEIYGCGYNSYGILGIGNNVPNRTLVPNYSNIQQVSEHMTAHVLMKTGDVYSGGYNYSGQLGLGDTVGREYLSQITTLNNIIKIVSTNNKSIFLTADGFLYGCGNNEMGNLGLGDETVITSPMKVENISNIQNVETGFGYYHTLALLNNGDVYGTGANNFGQLGIPSTKTFQKIPNINNVKKIYCGPTRSMIII